MNGQMSFSDDNNKADLDAKLSQDMAMESDWKDVNVQRRSIPGHSALAMLQQKKHSLGPGGTGGGYSQFDNSSSEFLDLEMMANEGKSPSDLPVATASPKSITNSADLMRTKPLGKSIKSSIISQSGATQTI